MKRSGVETRKRIETTIADNERPRGSLTDQEIDAIRRAYADGCRGELIIGMQGEQRIITMLVPETADTPTGQCLPRIREELRKMGCDGLQRVRRARSGR